MVVEKRNRTLDYSTPPFPEDFRERLKGMTGLSWGEFAELLSVTQRGLLKWLRGGLPCGRPISGPSLSWRAAFPAASS